MPAWLRPPSGSACSRLAKKFWLVKTLRIKKSQGKNHREKITGKKSQGKNHRAGVSARVGDKHTIAIELGRALSVEGCFFEFRGD